MYRVNMSLDVYSFKWKKAFKFKVRLGKLRHNKYNPNIDVKVLICWNNLDIKQTVEHFE